jgi:hypothetical protein
VSEMTSHDRLRIIADQEYRKTLADMELLHRDFEWVLDQLCHISTGLASLRARLDNLRG